MGLLKKLGSASRQLIPLLCVIWVIGGCATRRVPLDVIRGAIVVGSETELMRVAASGNVERLKSILAAGADVNARAADSATALHFAAGGGHAQAVLVLLEHGARLQPMTDALQTPLHLAALRGSLETVDVLLEKGADFDSADADGLTPFHRAVLVGELRIVGRLAAAGASADTPSGSPELDELAGSVHVAMARHFVNHSNAEKAGGHLERATESFERAAAGFRALEKSTAERAGAAHAKEEWQAIGVAVAQGVSDGLSRTDNKIKQRQLAQVAALRHASSSGTGFAGYSRALAHSQKELDKSQRDWAQSGNPTGQSSFVIGSPVIAGNSGQLAQQAEMFKARANRNQERASACRAARSQATPSFEAIER
jgi:hypothetical protein